MANNVTFPYEYVPLLVEGNPVSGAQIYVGNVGQDPSVPANQKPIQVRQGDGTTTTVAQPVRTNAGGIPVHNNQPVQIIVDGQYSLLIQDAGGQQLYFVQDSSLVLPNITELPGYNDLVTLINNTSQSAATTGASFIDAGIANAYAPNVIAGQTAPAALANRMRIFFTAAASNTGASTLNLNNLGVRPLVSEGGAALVGGEVIANRAVEAYYDGTGNQWVIIPSVVTAQPNTVNGNKIQDDTLNGSKVTTNTLNGTKILSASIPAGKYGSLSIVNGDIANNTIQSGKFPAPTAGNTVRHWSGINKSITPSDSYSEKFTPQLTGTVTFRFTTSNAVQTTATNTYTNTIVASLGNTSGNVTLNVPVVKGQSIVMEVTVATGGADLTVIDVTTAADTGIGAVV
jgi:hypothetical protein